MSLESCLGAECNMFEESEEYATRLVSYSPALTEGRFRGLLNNAGPRYRHCRIALNVPISTSLKSALEGICGQAVAAVKDGTNFS